MAIGTLAALAGAKVIGSAASYFAGRGKKPQRFGETPSGAFYRRIGAQGRISSRARSQILSRTGQAAGDIAQGRSADIRGYLHSQGFGGSVAGAALVDAPKAAVQKQLGSTARDIEIQNELSKVGAQERFAAGETASLDARRQYSAALSQNLIGGLTGAATDFIGGVGDIKQREKELLTSQQALTAGNETKIKIAELNRDGRFNSFLQGLDLDDEATLLKLIELLGG